MHSIMGWRQDSRPPALEFTSESHPVLTSLLSANLILGFKHLLHAYYLLQPRDYPHPFSTPTPHWYPDNQRSDALHPRGNKSPWIISPPPPTTSVAWMTLNDWGPPLPTVCSPVKWGEINSALSSLRALRYSLENSMRGSSDYLILRMRIRSRERKTRQKLPKEQVGKWRV